MTTNVGDVVLYLRSERRASLDVVDQLHPGQVDATHNIQDLYHLADDDTYVSDASFINITQVCRDIAELGSLLVDLETRLVTLARVVKGMEDAIAVASEPKTIGKTARGSTRAIKP